MKIPKMLLHGDTNKSISTKNNSKEIVNSYSGDLKMSSKNEENIKYYRPVNWNVQPNTKTPI